MYDFYLACINVKTVMSSWSAFEQLIIILYCIHVDIYIE